MRPTMVRVAALAASLVMLAATPAASQAAAPAVTPTRWQFAPDFRSHPNQNPFSSYLGGASVWSLRASQSLRHDGDYRLLPRFSSTFGSAGIKAWHGNTASCVRLPAIGVNLNAKPAALCTGRVPGKAAFARPTANRMAVVAWTSPFDGTVTVSHIAIADVDGSCGDGVVYSVDLGTKRLVSTRLANNDAKTLAPVTHSVRKGWSLNFIVEPGPSGNAGCDTTQLQITIDRV